MAGRDMGYTILVQRPMVDASYEGRPLMSKPITPDVAPVGVKIVRPSAVRLTDRARAMVDLAVESNKDTLPNSCCVQIMR